MQTYYGKTASPGIAVGTIVEVRKKITNAAKTHTADSESEINRFHQALDTTVKQLKALHEKALLSATEETAAIFEIHQMMLADEDYQDSVQNIIRSEQLNAEYAVSVTGDNFARTFAEMDDAYMKERAQDVRDISDRLLMNLQGGAEDTLVLHEACVIVADDLTPGETIQLDKRRVAAFVTRCGSVQAHTAILAKAMNIPAIVQAAVPHGIHGQTAVVDGENGCVTLDPDDQAIRQAEARIAAAQSERDSYEHYKGLPSQTQSGQKVMLCANIGGIGDLEAVRENDAEGIGLFRTEFLYLEKSDYPTEEEQFLVYKQVLEALADRPVIFRTLDIGADKQIGYFKLMPEENPALGYRAIRICLTREEIFKTQLRALYRASAYGNAAIMLPMIISVWEVRKAKNIIAQVRQELSEQQISMGEVSFGIMIETPAAVMLADELAKEVDFFSIGTNDLTQYTLAIDRQNAALDMFYDDRHPAVLKMIKQVTEAGHKAGIWVGICGEMGADLALTETFIHMGIDELSVSPARVLPLRKHICGLC